MKVDNPSARRYFLTDRFEAGVVLTGQEVKAVKTKGIQLKEAYIHVKDGEAYLVNAHIPRYQSVPGQAYDPRISRKLLVKKKELSWLITKRKGKLTAIPISCYTKRGWIKILVGVGKKRRKVDRKRRLIEKQAKRQLQKYR